MTPDDDLDPRERANMWIYFRQKRADAFFQFLPYVGIDEANRQADLYLKYVQWPGWDDPDVKRIQAWLDRPPRKKAVDAHTG